MPTNATATAVNKPPMGWRNTPALSHRSLRLASSATVERLLAACGELAVLRLDDDVGLRSFVVRVDVDVGRRALLRHGQRALAGFRDDQVVAPGLVGLDRRIGLRPALRGDVDPFSSGS